MLPERRGDPARTFVQSQVVALRGVQAVFAGTAAVCRRTVEDVQRQQVTLLAAAAEVRNRLMADLQQGYDRAIAQLNATELAKRAEVRAGLVEAAGEALRGLVARDRRYFYIRAFGWFAVGAFVIGGAGFAAGWYLHPAVDLRTAIADVSVLPALIEAQKKDAEALSALSDRLRAGYSPSELLEVRALQEVVQTGRVGQVEGDDVPPPCIAAVPAGAILVAGKPIKACVIALQDAVTVRGGGFLIKTLAGKSP